MGGSDGDHGSLPGRDREQALLARALRSAAEGSPRALFVHGEAGVGKTRLVRDACQASQLRTAWGSCVRFAGAEVPYTPIAGVLQDWLNSAGPTERDEVLAGADELAALLPSIGFGTAIAGGRLVPLVDLVISRLTDRRPTVVVVDDLQWADAASLDVLAYLIAGFRNQPLALIATCRDEARSEGHPLHDWLADMRRMPSFEEIHLERLDLESTADQIAGLTRHPRDLELAARVQAMSDGNPYLTELLVRDLPNPQTTPVAVPDALREALIAQWNRLSRESRDLTRLLAAAGRPVPLAVLTRVAGEHGINPEYVTDCLTEAETHGVIESTSGTPWFRHPLIADILYDGLPPTAAGKVHATYVRVLEATPDAAAADLAAHSHLAGRTDDAFRWSLQAADESARLHAAAEEAIHLRRACDLWASVSVRGSTPDRIQLLRRTSAAYSRIGEPGEAVALLDRALTLVDREAEPLLASAILTSRSRARSRDGAPSDLADAQAAVDLGSSDPDSPEYAMALAETMHAQQAVEVAERSGSEDALTRALGKRAAATYLRNPSDALADATRAAQLALSHGNLRDLQDATVGRLNALIQLGRYDEFLQEGVTAYWHLTDGGAGKSCHALVFLLIEGLLDSGRWDEARAMVRTALAARCSGITGAGVRVAAALLAARSGQDAEAELHLARAGELAPGTVRDLREGFGTPPAERLGQPGPA
ncbi:AAA family ATPase [Kribbella sp. NPDC050281]|uniref:ATP-binding protein n=1 Tax=Kribbella sp. NPDC050281 TaxID=3155515 RepID=UPI0033C96A45